MSAEASEAVVLTLPVSFRFIAESRSSARRFDRSLEAPLPALYVNPDNTWVSLVAGPRNHLHRTTEDVR